MPKILFITVFTLLLLPSLAHAALPNLSGRILLQVESHGEAWYVNPLDGDRYYLGRPDDAFDLMRQFGLGISEADFARYDSDLSMRRRLSGRIILQVESHGEAWYVNPVDLKRHYLGRPADAFAIISGLGLGISNTNLSMISVGGSSEVTDQSVPFTLQAPFGNWSDPRQEDGCEEAVVLMAMQWVDGISMTPGEEEDAIIAMSEFEKAEYGYFEDTSARDTADRLIGEYFGYHKYRVRDDVDAGVVLDELENGNILLVAINGLEMNHSHYRSPGPPRHMIVVHGYDEATGEFLTHDPGTSHGENHRMTAAQLNNMMRDYSSGVHLPVTTDTTAIVVVEK